MSVSVAIQGVKASFHDLAARVYFSGENVEIVPCSSFPILCKVLQEGTVDFSIMAIENSIAGSILPNYSLLEDYRFKIAGEIYLKIEMTLMTVPGQKIEDIRFVQSHRMALLQCEEFFLNHPQIQLLEAADTAESAEELSQNKRKGFAVIASRLAAETYGLEILKEKIEKNSKNYTRFLILYRSEHHGKKSPAFCHFLKNCDLNKASFRFEVPDHPGSLLEVLEIFNRYSINMTHLQSVVILGKPYQYSFHVDLEWTDFSHYEQAIALVEKKVLNLIHFGVYQRGLKPVIL